MEIDELNKKLKRMEKEAGQKQIRFFIQIQEIRTKLKQKLFQAQLKTGDLEKRINLNQFQTGQIQQSLNKEITLLDNFNSIKKQLNQICSFCQLKYNREKVNLNIQLKEQKQMQSNLKIEELKNRIQSNIFEHIKKTNEINQLEKKIYLATNQWNQIQNQYKQKITQLNNQISDRQSLFCEIVYLKKQIEQIKFQKNQNQNLFIKKIEVISSESRIKETLLTRLHQDSRRLNANNETLLR